MNRSSRCFTRQKTILFWAFLLISGILLISCGSKSIVDTEMFDTFPRDAGADFSSASSENGFSYSAKSSGMTYADGLGDQPQSFYEETGTQSPSTSENLIGQSQRKIIYSSYYSIQTAQFDEAIASLEALCQKYGAYYERSDTYGNAEQGNRNGSYTIRVPSENYHAFRSEAGDIGTVVHSTENNEDVSEKYFDTEARLSSTKMREERLLDILSKAESLDNVLLLESELANVRYEIESLSGSLRRYDSLINYSTVSMDIDEVMKPIAVNPMPKTFGERLSQAVSSGFRDFGNNLENLAVDASYALPGILVFIVVLLALIFIIKGVIRKIKKSQRAVPPVNDKTSSEATKDSQTTNE